MSEHRTIDKQATEKRVCADCGAETEHAYGTVQRPFCPLCAAKPADVFQRIEWRNRLLWRGLHGDDATLLKALES